jgi:hypothetical protein
MTNLEQAEAKLEAIDKEAVELLFKNVSPEHRDIAIDTYKFGLMLREVALDRLESKEVHKHKTLVSLLRSDVFVRMVLLLMIPAAKASYTPLLRLLSRTRIGR